MFSASAVAQQSGEATTQCFAMLKEFLCLNIDIPSGFFWLLNDKALFGD